MHYRVWAPGWRSCSVWEVCNAIPGGRWNVFHRTFGAQFSFLSKHAWRFIIIIIIIIAAPRAVLVTKLLLVPTVYIWKDHEIVEMFSTWALSSLTEPYRYTGHQSEGHAWDALYKIVHGNHAWPVIKDEHEHRKDCIFLWFIGILPCSC